MTKRYTVQFGFALHCALLVSVQAEYLEEALEKAILTANEQGDWKSTEPGPTFIDAVAVGDVADPFANGETVPPRYMDPAHRSINWRRLEADSVPTDQELLFFSLDKGPFCGFAERSADGELDIAVSYSPEFIDETRVTHWAEIVLPGEVAIADEGFDLAA